MADIIKIAEQLNSDVTRLNNERSKLEGMHESARVNYEKAIKAYEEKYGVKLTEETLQAEYNEVFAKTKGAILDLQEKIESIKRGDYKTDAETVDYDLEPDVEPIREEVEPKKKRGRKSKKEKLEEEVKVAEIEDVAKEAEEISDTPVDDSSDEDAPFHLDLNFDGFDEETKIEVPQDVKKEPKKEEKPKSKRGRKPLSASDISAAVNTEVVQNPTTKAEDLEDDEVALNIPEPKSDKTADSEDVFGDFGGFGDLGVEPTSDEKKVSSEEASFGSFGDLGDSDVEMPNSESDDGEIEDALPKDFSFGGFGEDSSEDEVPLNNDSDSSKKEDETVTPEGWGSDGGFGDLSGLDDLFKSGNFNLGV